MPLSTGTETLRACRSIARSVLLRQNFPMCINLAASRQYKPVSASERREPSIIF